MHGTTQDERNQLLTTNLWLNLVNILLHSFIKYEVLSRIINCTIFCIRRKKPIVNHLRHKMPIRDAFRGYLSMQFSRFTFNPWCDFFPLLSSRQMLHSIPSSRNNWDFMKFPFDYLHNSIIQTFRLWSSIINEIINLSFRSSKHIWNIHLRLSLLSNELEVYWILNGPLYNWKSYCWPSLSKRSARKWLNSQSFWRKIWW